MEPLHLRPMTADDLPGIDALCQARNVHKREYERFLGLEGAHGLVLQSDAGLVGAITVMRYFEHGFVGPVLLHPGADGVGLALALLARAIDGLHRSGITRIDAEANDDEAILLENLGFHRLRRTVVHERAPDALAARASESTRPMRDDDLLEIGALDASVAGYGRKEYLLQLLRETPEGARVVERDGEVAGYAMLRRSRRGYHLGPLVTKSADAELAALLARDATARVSSWPVVAMAPEARAALLSSLGFAPVSALTRMRAGQTEPIAHSATEWLLGGRVTG